MILAVPPELALAQQNILTGRRPPIARDCDSQPPHHLLHPRLPDVGVNLRGADALVPQQGLADHQVRPGDEPVRGVNIAQFMRRNFLLDPWFRGRRAPSWRAVRAATSVARRKQESLMFSRGAHQPARCRLHGVARPVARRKGSLRRFAPLPPASLPALHARPLALRLSGGVGFLGGCPAWSGAPVGRVAWLVWGCAVSRSFVVVRPDSPVPLCAPWWRSLVGSALSCGARRWRVRASARAFSGAVVVVGFRSASAAALFAATWSGWVGFPLAVRRFAGPVFGVSVPVAVPPSLRLASPAAWARAA